MEAERVLTLRLCFYSSRMRVWARGAPERRLVKLCGDPMAVADSPWKKRGEPPSVRRQR